MEFKKYQHVCRLGTQETEGILGGWCYIFPKIDGTNSSVWLDDEGNLCAGSRNKKLGLGKEDNRGFYGAMLNDPNINAYLKAHPTHRLFGEWLVPHSLRTYTEDAWNKFYIFDVCIDDGEEVKYLPFKEYAPLLEEFGLKYLPPLSIINNPGVDDIKDCVNNNTYAIKANEGCGEGIVIKNYDYKNKYGRIVWAKVLHDEYNNRSCSYTKGKLSNLESDNHEIEVDIVENFVTPNFIEKEYAKIMNDHPFLERKKVIPMLLGVVWHELIVEESWNIIKKYKNPTINYKVLNNMVINKIKQVKVDLFVK